MKEQALILTYLNNKKSDNKIFDAGYWWKGKKTNYTDEAIGKVRVVSDFLPSPEEVADNINLI